MMLLLNLPCVNVEGDPAKQDYGINNLAVSVFILEREKEREREREREREETDRLQKLFNMNKKKIII